MSAKLPFRHSPNSFHHEARGKTCESQAIHPHTYGIVIYDLQADKTIRILHFKNNSCQYSATILVNAVEKMVMLDIIDNQAINLDMNDETKTKNIFKICMLHTQLYKCEKALNIHL